MQVVINASYGGFGLSTEAETLYKTLSGIEFDYNVSRESPHLLKVIKQLGEKANGNSARLKIVTIPDDMNYEIIEYDGMEHIREVSRTWS